MSRDAPRTSPGAQWVQNEAGARSGREIARAPTIAVSLERAIVVFIDAATAEVNMRASLDAVANSCNEITSAPTIGVTLERANDGYIKGVARSCNEITSAPTMGARVSPSKAARNRVTK